MDRKYEVALNGNTFNGVDRQKPCCCSTCSGSGWKATFPSVLTCWVIKIKLSVDFKAKESSGGGEALKKF